MNKLRDFREGQCWSRETLALKCGVSVSQIARIEQGKNSSIKTLEKIAKALNKEIKDLI